ncbi:RNA 2',3'-cyclic phosphodiesterase [Clostridium sp. BL-8]|uniref:RNA 2',3'-cyclic phosphodiesterase n=1 Tax=Clostridium sp. BL-8 TaxID=349938 RepID=UPI00098BDE8D|nr:RNA 2',3'-cyclic phosphodiesterase [Clostridium sp. BL-8]OOM78424.1 2',5' RNA ligase family [Clostridium sp. BL-8]
MRVYIAIYFDNNTKNYFNKITSDIKKHCTGDNFTEKNNFHLTIRFIGEADELLITKIEEAIDKAVLNINPFELSINNLGIFKKKKTNILWIGIEENATLSELHKKLSLSLKEGKIPFYDKLFMPHITLGRRVLFNKESVSLDNLIQFERIMIPVKAISLMASKEINGKLSGIPIYQVNLI